MSFSQKISREDFKKQVVVFLNKELSAAIRELGMPNAQPRTLFGQPIGGSFTWSNFSGALAKYKNLSRSDTLAGQDIDTWILASLRKEKEMITFAQLGMVDVLALPIYNKGKDIESNLLYQKMDVTTRELVLVAGNVRSYYNDTTFQTRKGYPQNYLGVAALNAALSYTVGIEKDKVMIHHLLLKCITLLESGNGYFDDDKGQRGRIDRYGHEFYRFVYTACQLMQEKKLLQRLKPMALDYARFWWEAMDPVKGHSSPYGRSLQNSWDDTFEQAGYLASNTELRPASLEDLVAAYRYAFQYYIQYQYDTLVHLNRMLDYGKNTYGYAGKDRIWSYSVGTLGKMSEHADRIFQIMEKEKLEQIPSKPYLPPVSKLRCFKNGSHKMGIWIYRSDSLYFCLPIQGAFKYPGMSDYLPVPYGISGLEYSVAVQEPLLWPFVQYQNKTFAPVESATKMELSTDGQSLQVVLPYFRTVKQDSLTLPIQLQAMWKVNQNKLRGMFDLTATSTMIDSIQISQNFQTNFPSFSEESSLFTSKDKKQSLAVRMSFNGQKMPWYLQTFQGEDRQKGAFFPVTFTQIYSSPFFAWKQGQKQTLEWELQSFK